MLNNSKKIGDYGENVAVGYLIGKGYKIIKKNYKRGAGEIDIIASHNGYVVFVEVKYRRSLSFGMPREAVTAAKRRSILDAVNHYISENNLADTDMRMDVIEIFGREQLSITHIENAFSN